MTEIIPRIPTLTADTDPDAQTEAAIEETFSGESSYLIARMKKQEAETKGLEMHNALLADYVSNASEDRKARRWYSRGICLFVGFYIIIVLGTLFWGKTWFNISDSVLMVLLGSTSINVLGLLTIVLKFVFSNHHHKVLDRYNTFK